jgi:hypothetical protein
VINELNEFLSNIKSGEHEINMKKKKNEELRTTQPNWVGI